MQVSGLLVSGYLVSGKAFFEATGQQIVSSVAQNAALADQMRKMFATFESAYPTTPPKRIAPSRSSSICKTLASTAPTVRRSPADAGVWWRGEDFGDQWDCYWDSGGCVSAGCDSGTALANAGNDSRCAQIARNVGYGSRSHLKRLALYICGTM